MKVSIVTPVFNQVKYTKDFISGLAQTIDADFEVIVINNGSTDETEQTLRDYPHEWLKVIHNKENKGFGYANNQGAKIATGDALLFLNNDVVFDHAGWLKNLVTTLEKNKNAIVGAQLVRINDFTIVRGRTHWYINGWCMLMMRRIYDDVGGFDTGFGLGWFEDVWFSIRAEQLGYSLVEAKVQITHLGSKTITNFPQNELMRRAESYYRKKMIHSEIPPGKLRIVFMVAGNIQFSDDSWEGKGLGGAEASLVLLTREFAKQGHIVDVYNNPDTAGRHNGVTYFPVNAFKYTDYCDVFIIFRNPIGYIDEVNSPVKIFWSCDQYTVGDYNQNVFPFVDLTVCISEYHKNYFRKHYVQDKLPIEVIDLGVNLRDYENIEEKQYGKLIFCSVPRRGLTYLKNLFAAIREEIPEATLVITSDYRLWGAEAQNEEFISQFSGEPGVTFLGKIPRSELVFHQRTAQIMAYPCDYDENFCIAAAECMAAGTVPVTTNIGALETTVGKGGIVITGKPGDIGYARKFVDSVVGLIKDGRKFESYSEEAEREAVSRFDWRKIATRWEKLFLQIKEKKMINLLERLYPYKCSELSVLDLGCGEMISGIASQIPALPFKFYRGVEVWEKSVKKLNKITLAAKEKSIVLSDIPKFLEVNGKESYDFIFLFDVLEHFDKKTGLSILSKIEQKYNKRILIFIPMGDKTLHANDGLVEETENPYQAHKSQWTIEEFESMGYDVEFLKGFHHGGTLDAAWVYKDKDFMKKCEDCGKTFNSSYWLGRHRVEHGDQFTAEKQVTLASPKPVKMPDIFLEFKRPVEISVGSHLSLQYVREARIPYDMFPDVSRILTEAYGADIIESQEIVEEKT